MKPIQIAPRLDGLSWQASLQDWRWPYVPPTDTTDDAWWRSIAASRQQRIRALEAENRRLLSQTRWLRAQLGLDVHEAV